MNNTITIPHDTPHDLGLTLAQIEKFRVEFGWNELDIKKPKPLILKFLRQFADLLVIVLIVAGILSLLFGQTIDAIVILGIVFLNAIIGFIQEYRTERMLAALQKLVAPTAHVIRDGHEQVIPARELVPGDIIFLEEGYRVPADAELYEANELRVDESILTGESVPVYKAAHKQKHESRNVFSGTTIAAGSGKALVVRTGRHTEFGQIASLTTETKKEESPLTKEVKAIGVFVGKISLVISGILFVVGYFWQGYNFIESLLFSVAVAVAAVPEGLPVTLTTALALGMQRLARKKALVRELKSVETLGGTTVICSDKTGTLTRNQMSVTRGFLPSCGEFEVTGGGYDPSNGKVELDKKHCDAQKLILIGDVCNEAKLTKVRKAWRIIGDPTEAALVVLARKFDLTPKTYKRERSFPFDSNRKRMSVIVDNTVYAKGAPEQLLESCSSILIDDKVQKLDETTRQKILHQTNAFAEQGLRVLACAYRDLENEDVQDLTAAKTEKNLVFVGLIGMHDVPRSEVAGAVALCKQAGVLITVVTGDNGLTARAIAKEIGIADQDTPIVTGDELRAMSDQQLLTHLKQRRNLIFARVKPADKLRIVDSYKELSEVVAVTGDGVNDAPALKRSDIGIAMGRTGADVAKEAANIVLTDDSFATIVSAIEEGRRIYANMRKFILYIFSSNIGELVVIFAAIVFSFPFPLTAVLILMIDLGTDVLPSLALGVDPIEPDIMQRPPRDPRRRIMERDFITHMIWLGGFIGVLVLIGYFWILYSQGWSYGTELEIGSQIHRHGMSFAFATLAIAQFFNSFNFRSEHISTFSPRINSNPYLWGAVIISGLLVLAVIELPIAQRAFHTTHLSSVEWILVVALSSLVLFAEEIRKLISNHLKSTKAIAK